RSMGRSPCCEKAHTNKGAWTKEEDQRLIAYIKQHGEGCWRSLPKAAGMWSLIAGRLPGRTDNEIKNYWNTHIKRKLLARGVDPQTHRPLNAAAVAVQPQSAPSGVVGHGHHHHLAGSSCSPDASGHSSCSDDEDYSASAPHLAGIDLNLSISPPCHPSSTSPPPRTQEAEQRHGAAAAPPETSGASATAATTTSYPYQEREMRICLCLNHLGLHRGEECNCGGSAASSSSSPPVSSREFGFANASSSFQGSSSPV
ncbi:hypothetical protein ABZP36_033492, partial [Zizania latifolia]